MTEHLGKTLDADESPPRVDLSLREGGCATVELSGTWLLGWDVAGGRALLAGVEAGKFARLELDSAGVQRWDSSLAVYLRQLRGRCADAGTEYDDFALEDGVRRLLAMADASLQESPPPRPPQGLLVAAGEGFLAMVGHSVDTCSFIGEVALSLGRFAVGRARVRMRDLSAAMSQCGPQSLPIVAMINLLVGLVIAFIGATQLRLFGAQVFVADLVTIATLREMAPVMSAVILAGRIGAAYAATLGSMRAGEETDALETFGIEPVDFLVLPRLLAMALMTPLLVLYADLMGILGGALVGIFVLDLAPLEYYRQSVNALGGTSNLMIGLIKGLVFGILIAMAGCRCGMRSGRSSQAVGQAATSAVVASIVYIVLADSIVAFLCQMLGI